MHIQSDNKNAGNVFMKKNDETLCSGWVTAGERDEENEENKREGTWGVMTSCSAAVKLVQGDKVMVTGDSCDKSHITGNRYGFSGFLIYHEYLYNHILKENQTWWEIVWNFILHNYYL